MAKSNLPSLLHLSFVLQQRCESALEAEAGVGLSAARIMSVLEKSLPTSQRVIAMELNQTEANVSRQLRSMKKGGLVNITRNKKDNRQRDVTLSAKGSSRYKQAEKILKKQQKQILDILNSGEAAALEFAAKKLA